MRNGQGISDRQLADRLKEFGIRSGTVRIGQQTFKGYTASEFTDAWDRYLPPSDPERHKRHKRHIIDNENNIVTDVTAHGDQFDHLKDEKWRMR